jgi:ribosomal protein S18 acetylase RimI-like enzyme
MENEMDIRRAKLDDAHALAKIHIDSWRSAYCGIVPKEHLAKMDYDQGAQRFQEAFAANLEETYLAEENGEVFGFLTLGDCRDSDIEHETTGEIWGIYLAPQHWRKGIGRILFREGETLLKSRGYAHAVLWVFEANKQAREFFETMGFCADGAIKVLNLCAPLKAVRYRKELKNAEQSQAADADKPRR